MEVLDSAAKNKSEKCKYLKPNKYFLRQLLISTGGWTCCFILGLSLGTPTVMIPQIRAEANSTEAVTETVASWIPSIIIYSGLPWSCILPLTMRALGRKWTLMFVCISNLVSYTTLYFSTTVTHIIISEIIIGINAGGHFTVSMMIIAEYTSPKYRGFFLSAKSATLGWGFLVANVIGTFFHWKNIAIVGIACSIYSIIIASILPQSPYWLIMKHKFDECSNVYRWLKGEDKKSEQALKNLINYQLNIDSRSKPTNFTLRDNIVNKLKVMTDKKFYKPLLLCILIHSSYTFLGSLVISIYAIDVFKKVTKGQQISAYTTMLILDVVTITCMYIGCILVRIFTRRRFFISTTFVTILFLLAISVHAFMIKTKILPEIDQVAVALLVGYSIVRSIGPSALYQAIIGELVPLESRALSSCFIDISQKLTLGTLIKVSPYIFKSCGTDGAFLFYTATSAIFLCLVYKYLPETKDKTLQEIAESMQEPNKQQISSAETELLSD